MSNFSRTIEFIKQQFYNKSVVQLHEPVFFGNEKKYLNDTIESTFVSSDVPFTVAITYFAFVYTTPRDHAAEARAAGHAPGGGGGDGGGGGRISRPSQTPSHHAGISYPVRVQPLTPIMASLPVTKTGFLAVVPYSLGPM